MNNFFIWWKFFAFKFIQNIFSAATSTFNYLKFKLCNFAYHCFGFLWIINARQFNNNIFFTLFGYRSFFNIQFVKTRMKNFDITSNSIFFYTFGNFFIKTKL